MGPLEGKSDPESEQEEMDTESEADKSDSEDVESRSDQDLRTKIWSSLKKLETPTAFAFSDIPTALPIPCLYLPRHGVLGLPLSADDAQKIISEARQSPFGKGEETIVDTSVRKCWELKPDQFELQNPDWSEALGNIVDTACKGLGLKNVKGEVYAELNKLLLYEEGAFFKPHKDSEKAPGMFGTLVVCLPSPHTGGKLVMKHDNETYEFETADFSRYRFSYAAWYADITHEVLPVTFGIRLMLTYNLIRETDFKTPSYKLICGRVKQLSKLLEQYKSQVEIEDTKLPPILLHKLKHQYTYENLELNLLKPQDLAQVQTLEDVSRKLGFDVYLATLELTVYTDDDDPHCKDKEWSIKNIVELDGEDIMKDFEYPEGALIDPKPQDAGKRKPDDEEHNGPTGNEGSPATLWYNDAVLVLVPPSKQLDFVFQFGSSSKVIEPLFEKLMKKFSQDPAQKPKLEQLCELAVKQSAGYSYNGEFSGPIPPYFQRAAATALDIGRIDLFDKACERTCNKVMLDNAGVLGRWAANEGIATATDRLMKGVKVASTVAEKVKFLKSVAEGFETVMQEPDSAERTRFKQWSDGAILTATAELATLTKDDAVSLAQLCATMDWSVYESKVTPVILKTAMVVKIAFVNELMSILQQKPVAEQQSFVEKIIHSIWNKFKFNFSKRGYEPPVKKSRYSFSTDNVTGKDAFNEDELFLIIETSVTVLSPKCVETTIIPAMLSAIPNTLWTFSKELFISLVRKILKNELAGFKLPTNDAVPPSLHKHLIQACLTKFLMDHVGREPQPPRNWSLPARSCDCSDCSVINKFLKDPVRRTHDFQCSQKRRTHLNRSFSGCNKDCNGPTYDVVTITGCSPCIWRITKHRRSHEKTKAEWVEKIKTQTQTLLELKNDECVPGRLEAYLQPCYSAIMNAYMKELPDLMSLVENPETSENASPNRQD